MPPSDGVPRIALIGAMQEELSAVLALMSDASCETVAGRQFWQGHLNDHAVVAVEMEGAALAQVCHAYGIPLAVVRTLSDRADDDAHTDFVQFVKAVASPYSAAIVSAFLKRLPTA